MVGKKSLILLLFCGCTTVPRTNPPVQVVPLPPVQLAPVPVQLRIETPPQVQTYVTLGHPVPIEPEPTLPIRFPRPELPPLPELPPEFPAFP